MCDKYFDGLANGIPLTVRRLFEKLCPNRIISHHTMFVPRLASVLVMLKVFKNIPLIPDDPAEQQLHK